MEFNDNDLNEMPGLIKGYIAGLEAYAWWKDGTQYVGTTGTTLKQAVLRFRRDVNTRIISTIPVGKCPVCNDTIKLEGQTTDGKLVGSCRDNFLAEEY